MKQTLCGNMNNLALSKMNNYDQLAVSTPTQLSSSVVNTKHMVTCSYAPAAVYGK